MSVLVAQVCAGLSGATVAWDEIALQLSSAALAGTADARQPVISPPDALVRVTKAVRAIDREPAAAHSIDTLAREAGLSPFHFLRSFAHTVGVTPHQYVRRARLRQASLRLTTTSDRVIDIAFDCGFGDVSNFNRAFRGEFGISPTRLRSAWRHA
jgi:AraC-like DNA-binding protein